MVEIIEQFSSPSANQFLVEVDSATRQLARGKVRGWARRNYPTARPTDINVEKIEKTGVTESYIAEFVPDSVTRNTYEVSVGIKK